LIQTGSLTIDIQMDDIKNTTNISAELADGYETEGYVNRVLAEREAIKMLDMHGVDWHITPHGGLLAKDENDEDFVTITNWTLFDMLAYLNY
jgi:hypothetical protein